MKIDLPSDKEIASKVVKATSNQETKKLERGWVGAVFGFSSEKSGNIAGIALVILLLTFIGVLFGYHETQDLSRKDALTIVAGIITTILGFIFGKASS